MNGHGGTYTTDLEPIEGSDDLLLTLPEEFLVTEDWRAGDVLEFEASPGCIHFTNQSKRKRRSVADPAATTDGAGSVQGDSEDD